MNKFLTIILIAASVVMGANKYFDSNVGDAGSGTFADPYKAIASLTWSGLSDGDTVYLKAGSIFRETMTVGKGGTSTPIVVARYGSGARPVISGCNVITGWSQVEATDIYSVSLTTRPSILMINDTVCDSSKSATIMNDHEWAHASNVLYVRSVAGNPDVVGLTIEAAQRNYGISCANYSNLTFNGIDITGTNSYGMYFPNSGATNIKINNVHIRNVMSGLSWTGVNLNVYGLTVRSAFDITGMGIIVNSATANVGIYKTVVDRCNNYGIRVTSAAVVNIRNSTIVGCGASGIYSAVAVGNAVNIDSCIIVGNNVIAGTYNSIYNSSTGTLNLANSIVSGAPTASSAVIIVPYNSTVTVGDGVIQDNPGFKKMQTTALSLSIDDDDYKFVKTIQRAIKYVSSTFTGPSFNRISGTFTGASEEVDTLNAFVANGGDLGIHGYLHTDVSAIVPFAVRYTGGLTTTLNVTGDVLTVVENGITLKNLDLTNASYDKISEVVSNINGGTFTAASRGGCANGNSIWLLEGEYDLTDGVTDSIKWDTTQLYTSEITLAKSNIENSITGWSAKTYCYAGGNFQTDLLPSAPLKAAGFTNSRTVATPGALYPGLLQSYSTYKVPAYQSEIKQVYSIGLVGQWTPGANNDYGDKAGAATNSLTASGTIAFVTTPKEAVYQNNNYAYSLSGSSYMYRASLSKHKYSLYDWCAGAYIVPTTLSGDHVIICHGNDDDNYYKIYIDANGAIRFKLVVSGSEVISLASNNGVAIIDVPISVQIMQDGTKYMLSYGNERFVTTNCDSVIYVGTPADYTGKFMLGAGGITSATDNFIGYIGCAYVGSYTNAVARNQILGAISSGQHLVMYGHGTPNVSIIKTAWLNRIKNDFGGDISVKSMKDAVDLFLSNGRYSTDSLKIIGRYTASNLMPKLRSNADTLQVGAIQKPLIFIDTVRRNDTLFHIDSVSDGLAFSDTAGGYRDSVNVSMYKKSSGNWVLSSSAGLKKAGTRCTTFVKLSSADTFFVMAYGSEQLGGTYFSDTLPVITSKYSSGKTKAAITVQPENSTVNEGANATFTITATGSNLQYVCYRNGDSIGDANSKTFAATYAMNGSLIRFKVWADTADTVWSNTVTLTVLPTAPEITVDPVDDTTTGAVRMFAGWTGTAVNIAWYRLHGTDTTLLSRDSVLQFNATPAMDGDSIIGVVWNITDTVATNKAFIEVVYALFDSVATSDSLTAYFHGNFLSGTGWTATLSDSSLTTTSGSATNQVFSYNHKITLSIVKYTLVITNGDYTITLYIGRRKSTGNNKPRISLDIGL